MSHVSALLTLLAFVGTTTLPAYAAPSKPAAKKEDPFAAEMAIPKRPSAPPPLAKRAPPQTFDCKREFLYRGKRLTCDSNLDKDGEALRPIVQNVPDAVSQLDTYQSNRRKLQNVVYISTAGLLIAVVGGMFVSKQVDPEKRVLVRNLSLGTGVGIVAGTFLYSLSTLKSNEEHLGNVVNFYNAAQPNDRIELQFTTEF